MSSGSSEIIRFQISDFSGSPGMIPAPDLRSENAPSGVSSLRSASLAFWSKPWQTKQWSDNRGLIWLLKPMGSPVAVATRMRVRRHLNIED